MILVNGCSFTSGEESTVAWPDLIEDTVNIATPGASNDHILYSTVEFIMNRSIMFGSVPDYAIIAWTTPNRIEISGKHLTPTSQPKYGDIVDAVFKDWDEAWARSKFLQQATLMSAFLKHNNIPYVFVSAFDIQTWAPSLSSLEYWLGWPSEGLVEWMGDCPKGPGGHPLELGHQRIADKINEHIRNLGWLS